MRPWQRLVVRATVLSWVVVSLLAELGLLIGIGEDFFVSGTWSGLLGVAFIAIAVPLYCAVFALPCGLVGGLALVGGARLQRAPWPAWTWAALGAGGGAAIGAIPATILGSGLGLLAANGAVTGAIVAGSMARRLAAWNGCGAPGAEP